MKIIIVGAGVSGLSLYLQLSKVLPSFSSHEIRIYESHNPQAPSKLDGLTDTTAIIGNSIALAPSSVRLLAYIDPKLCDIFKARGYVNKAFTFRSARGHTLAITPTADGKLPEEGSVSCPRDCLRQCLCEVVGEDKIEYRRVAEVDLSGDKPVVRFEDAGEEVADLVVGADGARSVVKRAIFGEKDYNEYALNYEGFCGVGAFIDVDIPEAIRQHKSMVFTFGPSGSLGYCSAAPEEQRKLGWWSNWASSKPPVSNVVDPEEVRKQLRERHGTWKDPVIQTIIERMTTDRVYPIWTTPPLPHWGRSGAVLLGDAAHTLQATSGQGAAQALEDSVVFSLLLAHFVTKAQAPNSNLTAADAMEMASRGLYKIRHPRVGKIRARSRNLYITNRGILKTLIEYVFYCFLYLWINFPIVGHLVIGNVFKEFDEDDLGKQVEKYLQKYSH